MENIFTANSVRCTNPGDKEFSYASYSLLQKTIISKVMPTLNDTIKEMFSKIILPTGNFEMADLGCSSGPNTFLIISRVIDSIHGICQEAQAKLPEVRVFLNDLPENDFNAIFRSVPSFCEKIKKEKGDVQVDHPCFIVGAPGSFDGRLFPSRSLHFIHSSSSLHWLSKVPSELKNTNKGNISIAKSSPPNVFKAYAERFQKDFLMFLSSRSQELISGGRMVLTFLCRNNLNPWSEDCCFELLGKSLVDLVAKGTVKEADVDSFNLPIYRPYKGEVCEIIEREGSFGVEKLEEIEVDWDPVEYKDSASGNKHQQSGQNFSNTMRAAAEQMLSCHFGDAIIESLFTRFASRVAEHLRDASKGKLISILISITKK